MSEPISGINELIIHHLFKRENHFNKDGSIMLSKLRNDYFMVNSNLFDEYVTFPLYQRMLYLWKILSYQSNGFINAHLVDTTITNMGKKEAWIDLQCETCQLEISDRLQIFIENIYIHNHPEWNTLNENDFNEETLTHISKQYQPAYQLGLF